MFPKYDVIVVGAGHAGCEAAVSAANMGSKVLLATMNMNTIAQMSCNPAMGGVAKGQIVREIDALGGYSGIITDHTMIQFRMLNRSKGPAMWSPRAQSDRMEFAAKWRQMLEAHPNINFWQEMVTGVIVKDNRAKGIYTSLGLEIESKTVVLTNGTFLNGLIHIGEKQFGGGRAGERAATGLTEQLRTLGFESGRMKTGTPPRIDGRSLDWSAMETQPGDEKPGKFSYTETPTLEKQIPCHITYTSKEVHETLKEGFDRSPMFNGRIQGLGPRYCPSIEDKIERFASRDRHQLFVEPEGRSTCEIYVNGFSSSLPEDVQYKALRKVRGFEDMKMFRPGYAIEYDFFPPTQLRPSEEEPLIIKRSEGYIGVLIDDLVNKGTKEPYRMFTSRAEYRILLRQDNADIRLTPIAAKLGIRNMDARLERTEQKIADAKSIEKYLRKFSIEPRLINDYLESVNSKALTQKVKLHSILVRPNVSIFDLKNKVQDVNQFLSSFDEETISLAETNMKYQGYIKKEQEMVDKMNRLEQVKIRDGFNYAQLVSLSAEAREKLKQLQPMTIGQASRISGVSPSDISVLLVYMGR